MRYLILALGITLLLALPMPASAVPTGAQMMMTTSAKPGPAVTATLVANPTTINTGQSSTLTWSSTGAASCIGTNFSTGAGNPTSGSVSVSPTVTTTYTVTCNPAPTPVSITFATNPLSISDGSAAGVVVDNFTVNMSDGSTYHGTPTGACASQSPCPLAICGSTGAWQICTATALNSSYDIANANFTVTAN